MSIKYNKNGGIISYSIPNNVRQLIDDIKKSVDDANKRLPRNRKPKKPGGGVVYAGSVK